MSTLAVTVLPALDPDAPGTAADQGAWGWPPARRALEAAGAREVALGDETELLVVAGGVEQDDLRRAIEDHPAIRLVQLPSAGIDSYLETLRATQRDGLVVTSAKGAYSAPVAEHALALVLATLRQLQVRARATSWEDEQRGLSLNGRRVTIVGAGGIGSELLRLLQPFDVHVTMVRRKQEAVPGADRTVRADELDDVLPETDVLVVAAALTEGTTSLLGARAFGLLPDDAVLVNIARGGLVDTDALVDALAAGRLGGAGLDVTDPEPLPDGHPLWTEPRALVTPHQANTDAMTEPLFEARVRANVEALAEGREPEGVVDVEQGY
ncbi:D-isomer specific 2-hydroxyacid dehydrogenase family protein [Frigoribacterium salinisoli]